MKFYLPTQKINKKMVEQFSAQFASGQSVIVGLNLVALFSP